MARRARIAALVAALVASSTAPVTAAGGFARLHVTALSLSSDRRRVAVDEPFHVTIHLHVGERIGEPSNLFLPDLTNCEIEGAERRTVATADGTDYRETLTLQAQHPGSAHLTPARLLAINAVTGIPSQFASNDLTIPVVAAGGSVPGNALAPALRATRRLAIAAVLLALLALVIGAVIRRMRAAALAPVAHAPEPVAAAQPPARGADAELAIALAALARGRTPLDALAVRGRLFEIAQAPPGATLRDAMLAADGRLPSLRRALGAAERAAFAEDPHRSAAIDELLRAGEAVLGELGAAAS